MNMEEYFDRLHRMADEHATPPRRRQKNDK